MRRTQIYIDEQVDEQLRQTAAAEGRSAAALIREALVAYLASRTDVGASLDPILAMAGALRGLPTDASVAHDRDLYAQRPAAKRSSPGR